MLSFNRLLATCCLFKCYYRGQNRNISCSSKPILYGDVASPPVRFVMMTASVLNIEMDFHEINLFNRENKTEFYKKINPLQKVPALSTADEVICDSHAIALYMCRMRNNNELYPNDLVTKCKIDQMMYYNAGVLFPIDSDIFADFFAGKGFGNDIKISKWYTALDYLEHKLKKHKYLADDKMRLCDLCCGATVSSLQLLLPVLERHQNVNAWLKSLRQHSCFNINAQGLTRLQRFVNTVKIISK